MTATDFNSQHPRNHDGTWTDKEKTAVAQATAARIKRIQEDADYLDAIGERIETGEAAIRTDQDSAPYLEITGDGGQAIKAYRHPFGDGLLLKTDDSQAVRTESKPEYAVREADAYLGFRQKAADNGWEQTDNPRFRTMTVTYAAKAAPGVEVERDGRSGEYLVNGHRYSPDRSVEDAIEEEQAAVSAEKTTRATHQAIEDKHPDASDEERTSRLADNLKDYGVTVWQSEPGEVTIGHSGWNKTYRLQDGGNGRVWAKYDPYEDKWTPIGSDADTALHASWLQYGGTNETLREHSQRAWKASGRAETRLRQETI